MGPALAIVSAVGALATAGVAAKSLFSKPKSAAPAPAAQPAAQPITPAETPSLTTDAQSEERRRRVGSVGLTATSPLGVSGSPSTTSSKLVGN